MDVYAPLFNGTYYENTLQFLLSEYYNCYKSQKELIAMIPPDYTSRDKTIDQLLYSTEYNKRLILKEIVDLILYNENFKMTLRVSALMESNINKKRTLGPHPQVEQLYGGGGNMYLFAVFFFSFMSLYRALAEAPRDISTTIYSGKAYGNAGIQIISQANIQLPSTLSELKEGIQTPQSFVAYDENDPEHVNEFTRQYGITPIRENKQLKRPEIKQYIQEYVAPYEVDFSFPNKNQQFNKYLKAQVVKINELIKLLFGQIDGACESVMGIAQKDIIPIELYKIISNKVKEKVENVAEPLLDAQQKYISDMATNRSITELQNEGIVPPANVTLATRAAATGENIVSTGATIFNSLLNIASKSKPNSTNTKTNYTATVEQEALYDTALAKKYGENYNVLNKEAEQNIVNNTWQNVTEDLNTYFGQQQSVENRQRYFGTVCKKWFGIAPILKYDSENGILSISNSAESFSSFDIILRNIEENAATMPANPGYEDQRSILLQKVTSLRQFINRYNVKIFNVMNVNNEFPTIESFTAEVRGTVSNLTAEVAFINDNLLPIDQENLNKKILMESQANALALKQKRAEHEIGLNQSRENLKMSNENWGAFQNTTGDFVENVMNTTGLLAKKGIGDQVFGLGTYLITETTVWVNNLSGLIFDVLLLGGGTAVTVLSIYFLSKSIFRYISANIDSSTKRIENESYNTPTDDNAPSNVTTHNVNTPTRRRPSGWDVAPTQNDYNNTPYNFRPDVRNSTPNRSSRFDIDSRGTRYDRTPYFSPNNTSNIPVGYLNIPRSGRGGKKTRKNKNKKKTRKLKRGKRRQSRHGLMSKKTLTKRH